MADQNSQFIAFLSNVVQDTAIVQKNSTLQDTAVRNGYVSRVQSITPDVVKQLGVGEVVTTSPDAPKGVLERDFASGDILVDTSGFKYALSKYRDGTHNTPRRIRRRTPGAAIPVTPADRIRYVAADSSDGVVFLDQELEIVRTLANLSPLSTPSAGPSYQQARGACAATVAATELVWVACGPRHVVQCYNLATGAHVSTIGVHNTPGVPSDSEAMPLTQPVSVTVDEANSRLFVACAAGNGTGGDLTDAGFIAEFNVAVPSTPSFVGYVLVGNGLYRLNNGQCQAPNDVLFVDGGSVAAGRLWVANGLGDVAAFSRATLPDPFQPTLVLEAQGPGYTLGPDTITSAALAANSLDVLTGSDGQTRLYVSVDQLGVVEVFRAVSTDPAVPVGAHEATYGYHGFENFQPYGVSLRPQASSHEPGLTYGALAEANGVIADEVLLPGDGAASSVLVVADAEAGRVQRINVTAHTGENSVVFAPLTFGVDVKIAGWFIVDGDLPAEYVKIDMRTPAQTNPVVAAGAWREVPRTGLCSQPATTTSVQFRMRVELPRNAEIRPYRVKALGVLFTQV